MVKKAFTLIELIFSIIVMSIAFLAIPELFVISSLNIEEILKDEATFQGIRSTKTIMTYQWDENTTDSDGNNSFILDVKSGDSELDRYNNTQYRIGNYILAKKRKFYPTTTYASDVLGSEIDDVIYDDIDDFDNKEENITSSKIKLKLRPNIYYIDDSSNYSSNTINAIISPNPKSQSTNIKMIEVNITSHQNREILIYRTISCNIANMRIKIRELK